MEKKYVVLYTSYPTGHPRPANIVPINRWQFAGTNNKTFPSMEEAIEAIKSISQHQGYNYVFDVVQLVASVDTKPVLETVVTRY